MMLMRGYQKLSSTASLLTAKKYVTRTKTKQGGNMGKLFSLVVLSLCVTAPSFGADVVGHSVEVAGKDSYKAAAVSTKEVGKAGKDSFKAVKSSAKETGHAGKAVVKFLV
jgi:hypothetical protein